MENCIFCKIIKGEIPGTKVYEDEHTFAFLDYRPSNPGHTLVIPKDHYQNIYEMPEEILGHVMNTVKKLAPMIKKAVHADGINLIQNNDAAAGQVVFHSHTHIVPRFIDDGYKLFGHKSYEPGEAEEIAQKISKLI